MITSQEIYFEAIQNYIDSFKENKSEFNMVILPTKDTPILASNEAYTKDKLIYASVGIEETLIVNRNETNDNTFKCIIFYKRI